MNTVKLEGLPEALSWLVEPVSAEALTGDSLSITTGPVSDWFFDPASDKIKHDAPAALFAPPDERFLLSARVTVDFKSRFDAGALMIYKDQEHWAKLCFEYTPTHEPMIVSVVTRGKSDDCNSVLIDNNSVYLRVYRHENTLVFHHSTDGKHWHFVRHFTIGELQDFRAGFVAQSPSGDGCHVEFTEIQYVPGVYLSDIRNGE